MILGWGAADEIRDVLRRDDAVEVVARYDAPGRLEGPAVTRRPAGRGSAAYVSTRLDAPGRDAVLRTLAERDATGGDLTLAQLSILLTLLREAKAS